MRLIGYRLRGAVRVAALTGDGGAADLAGVDDFWADPAGWLAAAAGRPGGLAVDQLDLVPPVRPAARVVGVGLNYRAHAAEGGFELPEYPTVFARWTPSLSVSGTPVPVPVDEPGLDWEGELAVVIGTPLREASEAEARAGFLGYAVFNDLSARHAQRRGTQWTLGKNADASGPLGPIVTADEVPGIDAGLRLVTRVNGEIVQDTSTADMIFSPARVASYLSRTFTLQPGDIICTGTPSGVGHARQPEWFLTPGDIVSVEIEGLGEITNPVVTRDAQPRQRPA
ncbi:MAG TPA: fumarylacetoacetate hydrolase family protein [Trebonia sp.]|nr:fumarylacetoacetate hydrolase family protein [Trebonia sp.]